MPVFRRRRTRAGAVRLIIAAAATLGLATPLLAQAQSCAIPPDFRMPRASDALQAQRNRANPAPITRYTLALSWSPGYCQRRDADPQSMQCSGDHGRFGFILHGLWPESDGARYPEYCTPAQPLSRQIIRENLCVTPSPELLQHEWQRHGRCMTRDPARYFALGSALYRAIRYPRMAELAADRGLTVRQFRAAFVAANPGMDASMLVVKANRGGWLQEVHICLARNFRWRSCPAAQRVNDAGDASRLRIDPSL